MLKVLDALNSNGNVNNVMQNASKCIPSNHQQPVYGHLSGPPPEYSEIRGPTNPNTMWTNNEVNEWKQQAQELNNHNLTQTNHMSHVNNANINHGLPIISPNTPPPAYSHLRIASTPMLIQQQQLQQQNHQQMQQNHQQLQQNHQQLQQNHQQLQQNHQQLPQPPTNMSIIPNTSVPPPPPPPPPGALNYNSNVTNSVSVVASNQVGKIAINSQANNTASMSNLASALANAKLKKTSAREDTNLENNNKNVGGMASMMDEMAKTLARRRAQAEQTVNNSEQETVTFLDNKVNVNGNISNKDKSDLSR